MYLIIGASSFIGVYVVEEFIRQGKQVCVTCRNKRFVKYYKQKQIPVYSLDLQNKENFSQLPREGIEGVILLAGLLPANSNVDINKDENADSYFYINTIGTINVLEYCRQNNIKRVISTASYADVINSWSKNRALTEEEPRNYLYSGDHATYVFSKNAASDIMEYYNQQHGMKNAIFRFPMVYGVGPHGSFNVNGKVTKSGFQIFVERATKGEDIIVYGDADVIRDSVYVKDVAKAFYDAILSPKTYGLYNITSGIGVTLKEQAKIIARVFKQEKESQILFNPEIPNHSKSFLFSIEKAKRDFNYNPKFCDFKVMLEDYKNDLQNHRFKELFDY